MMGTTSRWANVTVREFFLGYNWSGTDRQWAIADLPAPENETALHLELTVAEFLRCQNWKGRANDRRSPTSVPPRELSISMTVAAFMRGISWEGTEAIAAPSHERPKVPISDSSPPIQLNQFSDLF